MKKYIPLLLLICLCSCNKIKNTNINSIVIGSIDSIYSSILKEQRKIWVYVPKTTPAGIYAPRQYPVLYLLDGDAHFSSVQGMIQQLSTVNGNMICPEMIIVGIPNTDRTRDLTPTHVTSDLPYMDSSSSRTSGGGEKFIDFIKKELIPHIDSLYPIAPYRMLVGHSFGGLTVMNTLLHHTEMFNSYIAIDPSMWWDHEKLLKESGKILSTQKFTGKTLYLGIANTMDDNMSLEKVIKDTTSNTRHIRSILQLKSTLEKSNQNGLRFSSKYYPTDDHGSVPLITEYDALHFIFDFYPMKMGIKEFLDSTINLASKFEKHFDSISNKIGYQLKPTESMINELAYNLLSSKQFKKSEQLFQLNIKNYPKSFNVFDSMGDYYTAMGDQSNAIKYFQKALTIKENTETRQKIKNLQKN